MKKCVVISDSFKGTLSSKNIIEIVKETVAEVFPDCQVIGVPIADGGEGTVDYFLQMLNAQSVSTEATGPFIGETVKAVYGRVGDAAVIETAAVAGLPLVEGRKDPTLTTTYGVGELIGHAVDRGCRNVYIGLGGSCTNDGGCGCAAALGTVFLNGKGRSFIPVGGTLNDIVSIDNTATEKRLNGINVVAMSDVENPLWGPDGAAYIYAPQKGAVGGVTRRLDDNLRILDRRLQETFGRDVASIPGAGAAGGMGAGCTAFLGAEIRSGVEALLDLIDFDKYLEDVDLVITGEGRVDSQSLCGKVVSGVARRVGAKNVPLIAIAGSIEVNAADIYKIGVDAMFSTNRTATPFTPSAGRSEEDYRAALLDILRLIRVAQKMK